MKIERFFTKVTDLNVPTYSGRSNFSVPALSNDWARSEEKNVYSVLEHGAE
jgi:hypothetical protein